MLFFSGQISGNSTALLAISIGQLSQTGDEFKQMVDVIVEQNFSSLTILKADTLQHHNIALKLSLDTNDPTVTEECLRLSQVWQETNALQLVRLEEKYQSIRSSEA